MRTERGFDRLITFLDAIVAIAITLLVLPLVDRVAEGAGETASVGALLHDERGAIAVFVLSFVVIARLWSFHHNLIEHAARYDRAFLLANLVWAFAIVVLPFATQLTATYGTDRGAVAVYVGTIAVSTAAMAAIALLLDRRPGLRRDGAAGERAAIDPRYSVSALAACLLALLLGVTIPAVGYFGLLLLVVDGRAADLVAGGRR